MKNQRCRIRGGSNTKEENSKAKKIVTARLQGGVAAERVGGACAG
jgi:hypothetical protein